MKKYTFNEKKASNTFTGIQLTKKTEGTSNETIEKKEDTSVEIHKEERENILNHFKHPISELTYNKSYSRTWLESSIVEYTWEINSAIIIFKTEKEFFSARFPKTSLYRIKLSIDNDTSDVMKSKLRFYLVTEKKFKGTCDVCVVNPFNSQKIKCKSTSPGLISNMILLYETTLESLKEYLINNKIVMYFKIEIIYKFLTQNIHIDVPLNTTLCEELNFKRSNFTNLKVKSMGLITFKFKRERYNLPAQTLYATNSEFFKSICDYAMVENEKGIYEIEIDEMPVPFKQMLSFILSGSIPDPFNYHMLRDLLIMASKYNVQTLKILCESYLIRMINIENSIDLIQLALTYNAKSLEKYTALFIKLYLKEIVHTQEFQCLPQYNFNKIMKLICDSNLSIDIKLAHDILWNTL
ncbi:uncharacterized protein LOC112637833 [Camponotus floridanus]|uniref:uncharacterized protein LOC112637833 n=1 Tax=Camponotus floridanus TaxID=104421 RepID=UPI000DC6BB50|nr:uncharacterized protein LOC112637833 [Camponotus floridanus]